MARNGRSHRRSGCRVHHDGAAGRGGQTPDRDTWDSRADGNSHLAAVGKGDGFDSGRDFAAGLGLVLRQATTGGKPRLLGISKRGNAYVRRLFIHGARAVMRRLAEKRTRLGQWLRGVLERRHYNVAVVALANKLARIAWTVLAGGGRYAEFVEAR